MDERRQLARQLDEIQQQVKELEIRYEQYFAGLERREPMNERKNIAKQLRHFTNRHIVWTDLRFRHQSISSRFMSYGQYWDRILRLMDEGKYHRHIAKLKSASTKPAVAKTVEPQTEAARLQQELSRARASCGLAAGAPSAEKIADFLAVQREKIRNRYGDRQVVFSIDSSGDKPRIKVSLKQ
ncbi:MAG: hypothetical protein KAU22_08260 [Desulfuromonadales bacterium]|nr:hypothetical protein [Desulfuromonadales bacterium]